MNAPFLHAVRRILIRGTLLLVLGGPWLVSTFGAEAEISKEYQVKAVFLFNLLQFTEWPSLSVGDQSVPIRIGVLGQNPFGSALEETVRGETARGHKLLVQYAPRLSELRDCQLLFISASEKERLPVLLAELGNAAILTVSEIPDFARRGGIVRLYSDGRKVRFEVNLQAAQIRGLRLDAQLLSLAKIISVPVPK